MKYLKTYTLFESNELYYKGLTDYQKWDIILELQDISLEVNDIGIETECYYNNPYIVNSKIHPGFISVGMQRYNQTDNLLIHWSEISDTIKRIIGYMESQSWKASSLLIDGERITDPVEWIKIVEDEYYNRFRLYGLTINFQLQKSQE